MCTFADAGNTAASIHRCRLFRQSSLRIFFLFLYQFKISHIDVVVVKASRMLFKCLLPVTSPRSAVGKERHRGKLTSNRPGSQVKKIYISPGVSGKITFTPQERRRGENEKRNVWPVSKVRIEGSSEGKLSKPRWRTFGKGHDGVRPCKNFKLLAKSFPRLLPPFLGSQKLFYAVNFIFPLSPSLPRL